MKAFYVIMVKVRRGERMTYFRETWLEIDLDAIYDNITNLINQYAEKSGLIAVIKADAYGHGAVMVAKTAFEAGAKMVAVASLDEAMELRKHKVEGPILVFGLIKEKELKLASINRITVTAHSLKWVKSAVQKYYGPSIDVHINIDTGMHRLGIEKEDEFIEAVKLLKSSSNMQLTGLYSHFASADDEDRSYYDLQHQLFLKRISKVNHQEMMVHLDNSSATINYPKNIVSFIRLGITLYGLKPVETMELPFELKPALKLFSKLSLVRKLPKGSSVSYNGLYVTKEDEWIGTLPIGYADGWDRRMKDGVVYIEDEACPIVGRICMDYCMIRLPKRYKEGTTVELIGSHIGVDEVAKKINTNNYQTICALSDRIVRIYKRHGKTVKVSNRRLQSKL
jgi:alanine racemase